MSAEFYKKIFELVPASIVIVDKQGHIIDISPHHITDIGRGKTSKDDYLEKNILDHPSVKNAGLDLKYKKVLSGESLDEKNVFFPATTGGHPGFFNVKAAPIFDGEEIIGAVMIHENITEQNNKTKDLEEANLALKVVLQQTINAKQDIQKKILDNIELLILPYIEELKEKLHDTPELSLVKVITENLESVTSSFVKNIRAEFLDLTPREIQVTNFIRQGKSNKDIARLLNLSIRTIEYYRSNLRRKFKINNKKISLRSYLLIKS